jgi:hypothetical protein
MICGRILIGEDGKFQVGERLPCLALKALEIKGLKPDNLSKPAKRVGFNSQKRGLTP